MQVYPYQITQKLGMYCWNHQAILSQTKNIKVYLGCNCHNASQMVIIKEYKLNLLNTPDVLEKIKNEIQILQQIKSQYLVRVLDLLCTTNRTCIILEYCPDGNLMNYILKQKRLEEQQARQILCDIVKGVKELVKMNIFHRNLKPENILISRTQDNNFIFKITDFSFSKLVKNLQESKSLMISSKDFDISYFSSPQILKDTEYTTKSDLWSIGMIYYFMLYGGLPWTGDTQEEFINNINKQPLLFPSNIQISQESQSIISKTLRIREQKRIDWNDFFNHPIFNQNSQLNQKCQIIGQNLTKESEKFVILLQDSIYNLKIDIKQLFLELDDDKNMALCFQEFLKLLLMIDKNIDQKLAEKIFEQFDADKNGTISYAEFKQLILKTSYQPEKIKSNKEILNQEVEKITQNIIGMIISIQQNPKDIFYFYSQEKNILKKGQFFEFLQDFNGNIPLQTAELVFKKFATEEAEAIDLNKMINYFEELRKKLNPQLSKEEKKQEQSVKQIEGMSQEIKNLIYNLKNIITVEQLELSDIFQIIDSNSNGILGYDEAINSKLSENVVKELFQLMDKNKDGAIELAEFKELFENQK